MEKITEMYYLLNEKMKTAESSIHFMKSVKELVFEHGLEAVLSNEFPKGQVMAVCLKTYPYEGDMDEYSEGNKEPDEVQIYFKGGIYLVCKENYCSEYYMLMDDFVKED